MQAAFAEFQEISEDPELQAATEDVQAYLLDECGIDIEAS